MSEKRHQILKVALRELGKHGEDGSHNGRYYQAGYNWCSEFVSWVYYQSGYPFVGGSYSARVKDPPYDGDWMQRTTNRIVAYFKDRKNYYHRDGVAWYDLLPKPGDFVFIGRVGSDRMHSGLVEYLGNDGTLHTIEGNNAGRKVMKFSYPYYKINDGDNGEANGVVMGVGVI